MRHIHVKQPSMSFTFITINSLEFLTIECYIWDVELKTENSVYIYVKNNGRKETIEISHLDVSFESPFFQASLQFQMTWVLLSSINITIDILVMHVTWSEAGVCLLFFLSVFLFVFKMNTTIYVNMNLNSFTQMDVCDLIQTHNRLAYLLITYSTNFWLMRSNDFLPYIHTNGTVVTV